MGQLHQAKAEGEKQQQQKGVNLFPRKGPGAKARRGRLRIRGRRKRSGESLGRRSGAGVVEAV
jgi:hypothetical protein